MTERRRSAASEARFKERIDRIRTQIPMAAVLAHYGYRVREDGGDREQQFACDMHADGHDSTPSARAYGDHTYCFGCGTNRDAIDYVMIKENATWGAACRILEKRYGLPYIPYNDDDDGGGGGAGDSRHFGETGLAPPKRTFDQWAGRIEALLLPLTRDRVLACPDALAFWESFDKVCHLHRTEKLQEDVAVAALDTLRQRVLAHLEKTTWKKPPETALENPDG